ncbi:MAG: hypothetical protein KGJ80_04020 [Chloroflexota bacterium]|nr:hypothetical protein [Chloroflexota bacterium]
MKARVAVLADCANVTADGKLNIMGVFNVINAHQVPVTHSQMQLVLSLVPDPWEVNTTVPLEIQLVDSDGRVIFGLKGQVSIGGATAGEQSTANYLLALNNTAFERFGFFEFKVLANDEPFVTIPLIVQRAPAAPSAEK